MPGLVLYSYFRSSAAYRVRISLHLKGLDYETRPVHLLRDGGENFSPEYLALNPQGLIPALVDDGQVHTQSLAIIEYLEERYPDPPLLPPSAAARARVRALSQIVACDIHPLNNLRVRDYVKERLGHDESQWLAWYRHWIREGFQAFEALLATDAGTGQFCQGGRPTLADACLVPQVFNARRFDVPLEAFPTLCRIAEDCGRIKAFRDAAPENQPDAE
ncbi:MAG: maleylacetoacetate isomerase [Pseudomonadota bacterium]|nr:maleylacetoacetate isomerase [Pseudomonadota bacterium]